MSAAGARWALDHLVVAARTLEEGVAWCEAVLGATPAPGGRHPLMGTHNRLLAIGSPAFPRSYLEILAVDPDAAPPADRRRWFDLDDPALAQRLVDGGPALVHWVARCDALDEALARQAAAGEDGGEIVAASRQTARGELRWRIALRRDGRRGAGGAWPTLIEWGEGHPADALPASGITLEAVSAAGLPAALDAVLPAALSRHGHAPPLQAVLHTPRGRVALAVAG